MKRVLLTGAAGFVGSEMPRLLAARGYEVHSAGRHAPDGVSAHHICDLLQDDLDALAEKAGASHLLHLAWYAEPGRFWSAPENLDWAAASLRLARAFRRAGGERMVGAGSCAEYDWSHATLDEALTPLAPATLYGESKAAVFRLVSAAAPDLGLSFAWGRIFFLYGPGEKPGRLVSDLFDGLAKGETVSLSAGTQKRDFLHVEDVAAAFAALLDSRLEGAVNIASGQAVEVRGLAELAERVAGGAGRLSFGARPLQPGEPPLLAASIERLRTELGFHPRFTLEEGLRDTYERRSAAAETKD